MISKYFTPKPPNPLVGESNGACANRFFNVNSLCTLIAENKIKISCNQIQKKHTVSVQYARRYEKWMDRAVSNLIDVFLVDTFTLFPLGPDLYFDTTLKGTENYEKRVRIFLIVDDLCSTNAEIFLDTVIHDNGVF